MGKQEPIKKPATVNIAVMLVDLTIAAGFLSGLVWYAIYIPRYGVEPFPVVADLTCSLATKAAFILLVFKISRGKNWARVLFTLFVVISILTVLCPVGAVTAIDPSLERLRTIFNITGYLFLIVQFIAMVLLFIGESRAYFRPQKPGIVGQEQAGADQTS